MVSRRLLWLGLTIGAACLLVGCYRRTRLDPAWEKLDREWRERAGNRTQSAA